MALFIGDMFPNFQAETQNGPIDLYNYVGNDCWFIFCCHPGFFTPVCTTELAKMLIMNPEFAALKVKFVAMSFGNKQDGILWIGDVCKLAGGGSTTLSFPLVCDENREVALLLGMIRPEEKDKKDLALTARHVFICDKNKILRGCITYPAQIGRDYDEILRFVKALQVVQQTGCSCPVNWQPGQKVLVPNPTPPAADQSVTNITPVTVPSGKEYIRYGETK